MDKRGRGGVEADIDHQGCEEEQEEHGEIVDMNVHTRPRERWTSLRNTGRRRLGHGE